jgi:hypothetical protein
VDEHHFVPPARSAGREPQLWQLPAIRTDQILDKPANIGGELVKLFRLSRGPIKLHELSLGDVPSPFSLPRLLRVRLILKLLPLSASISHFNP